MSSNSQLPSESADTGARKLKFSASETAVLARIDQFILDPALRVNFFRSIANRLRPDRLISADLASDMTSAAYEDLLKVWFKLMIFADVPPENLKNMRTAYSRHVAVLSVEKVSSMIAAGGFDCPTLILQRGLIHGWYAKRADGNIR